MIQTLHLFRPLNRKLIELLASLAPADWSIPTVAGTWMIKDAFSPESARHQTKFSGDAELARPALEMLSVMALR
jgi:hypothetical protein